VAKWWPEGREGRKTAACGALGNDSVAKFQLQLLSIRFRLSQFCNPRLYLLYRFKDGTIEDLDIAFPGNVRFRVAQDALHDFVLGSHCVQVRGKSSSERVPTVPRQADGLECSSNHTSPNFVHADGKPIAGVKNHTYFWVPLGPTILVQDFRQAGITGTESRLARVFGRLTTDIQIERLITNSLPV
jgi:hypothetical protein